MLRLYALCKSCVVGALGWNCRARFRRCRRRSCCCSSFTFSIWRSESPLTSSQCHLYTYTYMYTCVCVCVWVSHNTLTLYCTMRISFAFGFCWLCSYTMRFSRSLTPSANKETSSQLRDACRCSLYRAVYTATDCGIFRSRQRIVCRTRHHPFRFYREIYWYFFFVFFVIQFLLAGYHFTEVVEFVANKSMGSNIHCHWRMFEKPTKIFTKCVSRIFCEADTHTHTHVI